MNASENNNNAKHPNIEGISPDETAPKTRADLTAGEAMLLAAVRSNDLRMFLSATEGLGWLDDPRMALCNAVHNNDLRAFLMALNLAGLLTDSATEDTEDTAE